MPVTHLAVKISIRAVIVVERVQHVVTGHTPEAVTVKPFSISCHHLLRLEHLPATFGAAVLAVLLRLDDPGLHGGPGQHVVLVVVELGEILGPSAQRLSSGPGAGLAAEVGGIAGWREWFNTYQSLHIQKCWRDREIAIANRCMINHIPLQ